MKFVFIAQNVGRFSVRWMCKRLGVSTSGYYAWRSREPSARAQEDERLRLRVRVLHARSRGTYGSPRIHVDLKAEGTNVSRKRVARLVQEEGLQGRPQKRPKQTATEIDRAKSPPPNVVERDFFRKAPNACWAADITYVRTWEGWLYLAVVLDLYSRRVVGYATADNMRTEVALNALDDAVRVRRPPPGLIHHSDRGSQYMSDEYQAALDRLGAVVSMSRKADCYDNAVAESFFATLKKDVLHRKSWTTRAEAAAAIEDYIDGFYNVRRRHSTLGFVSPVDYELSDLKQRSAA